jgi:CDGSH-type Zn-finger protein
MHHTGSIKVGPSDKPISICACGLSRTFPICDGAHKAARLVETDPTALYVYDSDRRNVVEVRPDDPPPPEPAMPAIPTPLPCV